MNKNTENESAKLPVLERLTDMIFWYYINHLEFTPSYEECEEFKTQICKLSNMIKFEGSSQLDYLNLNICVYLTEYAKNNNEPIPNKEIFTDMINIIQYNQKEGNI